MLKLKACRETVGISQKALAGMIGVNETTIIRWEKQRTAPNTKQLVRLSEILGVAIGDLCAAETAQ